ncbi:MAG: hypothetical protein J0H60_20070 [Rhizobiales bacterium]|nr:hypothetical protein [Hyphomicrobiales bacterium]
MRRVEIRPAFTLQQPLRSPTVPAWAALFVGMLIATIAVSIAALVMLGGAH